MQPQHAPEQPLPSLDELRKLHIVITDEDPVRAGDMKRCLQQGGFRHVLVLGSGREVIVFMNEVATRHEQQVDMLILNAGLSDIDGYRVCRTIKDNSRWHEMPLLMLTPTVHWQEDIMRRSIKAGATDLVFGPVTGMDILPRIISGLSLKLERDRCRQTEQELRDELNERAEMEERLQYLVGHDDLTGLFNRRRLEQAIEIAVMYARYKNKPSALFYIDLDRFKIINNTEGHVVGDKVLVDIAGYLRKMLGPNDTIARIGADDYAILVDGTNESDAIAFAEQMRYQMENYRYESGFRTYKVGASIGVATIRPGEMLSASDILAHADQACFIAKQLGRNMVHLFSEDDNNILRLKQDIAWVERIQQAIHNDAFRLIYQPILDIRNNRISHLEVLIRMTEDGKKLLTPAEFIPVAERMGLIHEIDRWVVARAINTLSELPDHMHDICLGINLSGRAFEDPALVPLISKTLQESGVDARRIIFEITETSAIANLEKTRDLVEEIRRFGCLFSLDDFGSGFSSYDYLRKFPVDYLKIDGAFITNLPQDATDQALVKSMIEIAHTLDKKTIAEYVENIETFELLKEFGIDYIQGHFIGKPDEHYDDLRLPDILQNPLQS